MVQELVVYPDERIMIPSTDVRIFDEKLVSVIEDMKDTMNANGLTALSAIQIAYPYNIIIIKDASGIFKEYINPRIIKAGDKHEVTEKTSYYPNTELLISRYKTIKIVYEDRSGTMQQEEIDDPNLSATMQRKIDYLFAGTFLAKVPKNISDNAIKQLSNGGYKAKEEICPLFSKKDYFVSFANKVLFLMVIFLVLTITKYYDMKLWISVAFASVILTMIGFFFYAQYEAKQYKQCTSCQIGNNIGMIVKRVGLGLILFALSRFF